jgi:hypothetical protein
MIDKGNMNKVNRKQKAEKPAESNEKVTSIVIPPHVQSKEFRDKLNKFRGKHLLEQANDLTIPEACIKLINQGFIANDIV